MKPELSAKFEVKGLVRGDSVDSRAREQAHDFLKKFELQDAQTGVIPTNGGTCGKVPLFNAS